MRVRRTTAAGTTYTATLEKEPPEPRTLKTLDLLADAAARATWGREAGEGGQQVTKDHRDTILRDVRLFINRRKAEEEKPLFTPAGLMAELRISRNLAASLLEELEAVGELARCTISTWTVPPAAQKIGRGYALPLSPKEAGALWRLLDAYLVSETSDPDLSILREIRRRLKGGPL